MHTTRTLYVVETNRQELKEKWGFDPILLASAMYIQCNSEGQVKWDKASVYTPKELKGRKHVIIKRNDYGITVSANKTLNALRNKADWTQGVRMPSIKAIHALLEELEIPHEFSESENVVERRSKGNRYVNSRHTGKVGWKIVIREEVEGEKKGFFNKGNILVSMDTSDSYYTYNTSTYATELMEVINAKTL